MLIFLYGKELAKFKLAVFEKRKNIPESIKIRFISRQSDGDLSAEASAQAGAVAKNPVRPRKILILSGFFLGRQMDFRTKNVPY